MNIDSINDDDAPFNKIITQSMQIVEGYLRDPLSNVKKFNLIFNK